LDNEEKRVSEKHVWPGKQLISYLKSSDLITDSTTSKYET